MPSGISGVIALFPSLPHFSFLVCVQFVFFFFILLLLCIILNKNKNGGGGGARNEATGVTGLDL